MVRRKTNLNEYFLSYEEFLRLKPLFQKYMPEGNPYRDRLLSSQVMSEMSHVREDVDYSPLRGYQCTFTDSEFKFFNRILTERR